jgi:hypothetical protein
LAFAAAVLGSSEIEVVAEDAEKSAVGVGVETAFGTVDVEFCDAGHDSPIVAEIADARRR